MAQFQTNSGTGTFRVATPDGMVPHPGRELNYSLEHRPYSNIDVLDIGGYSARKVRWPVIIEAAYIGTMEARLGETGTLTETSMTETATLLELSNIRKNFDGTHYWADTLWLFSS